MVPQIRPERNHDLAQLPAQIRWRFHSSPKTGTKHFHESPSKRLHQKILNILNPTPAPSVHMQIAAQDAISKARDYIDQHLQDHIDRLKQILRIPSIAADNPDGIQQCAQLLQNWFRQLGCQQTDIVPTEGSPVVYAHYNAHAKNTLLIYMMYDVKQVTGENWTLTQDPFKPQLVQLAPFKQVIVARGAYNTKGPLTAFLNALQAIKATGEEPPVNLRFIAEGEEELGSQHLIDFINQYRDKLQDATACFAPSANQNIQGVPNIYLGCKGVVELELECSGQHWQRGPTQRGIHSSLAAIVESPVWRMVQALATMTDPEDPSKILIEGFYDNVAPPTPRDQQIINELAKGFDENSIKQATDVKHFLHDLHGQELLTKALYTTTLNIQGISGGFAGPKFKTVLPHNVRVKLESRIIPNQTRTETVEKIRKHLDKHGYNDIKIVDTTAENSDDWSRTNPDASIVKTITQTYQKHGHNPLVWPFSLATSPQYIWTKHLKIPFLAAGLGYGARAHAPDEYYVIQGNGEKLPVAGLAEVEKFFVDLLYEMKDAKLS